MMKGTWESASACTQLVGKNFGWIEFVSMMLGQSWPIDVRNGGSQSTGVKCMLARRQRGLATSNISTGALLTKVFINWKEDKMWPFLSIDLSTLKWVACKIASTSVNSQTMLFYGNQGLGLLSNLLSYLSSFWGPHFYALLIIGCFFFFGENLLLCC